MQCKIGDLAVIIRAANPKNIGKIVRVVEPWGARRIHNGIKWSKSADLAEWLIESIGSPLVTSTINRLTPSGPIWDSSLRPIRDDGVFEETAFPDEIAA